MKDGKNEFLGLLCNLYIVILLVALPLYTGEGYWQLGDTKYMLFRNTSLLCLGGWLLAGMPGRISAGLKVAKTWKSRRQAVFSGMDGAMLLYAAAVVLSAVCSSYGKLAWDGYEGWYMGAVSQLLFVGIYFFVSRQYDGASWPIRLGEGALFLVTLLGLLHRLGIDPLGLMAGWNSRDWEYTHMLSTLGNVNWLCGYYSVALSFVAAHYLQVKKSWQWAVLYLATVAAFLLLCIQGSQGGLLILAVCVAVGFLFGTARKGVWRRVLLLLPGTLFSLPLMEKGMELRGDKAAMAADGNIFVYTDWYGWTLAAVICLFFYFILDRKGEASGVERDGAEEDAMEQETGFNKEAGTLSGSRTDRPICNHTGEQAQGREKHRNRNPFQKKGMIRIGGSVAVSAVLILAAVLLLSRIDDGFGSGRGYLWRIGVEGFRQAGPKDKLLGAGPDCYGEAVFNKAGAGTDVWKGEHWEGAVFTNAHNEFLSQLCNIGILGAVSYLLIFLVGMTRYGRAFQAGTKRGKGTIYRAAGSGVGILALAMYGGHSLISFQQVLNAPLLFLVLGLCEAELRQEENRRGKTKRKNGGTHHEVEEIQDQNPHRSGGYHDQHPL